MEKIITWSVELVDRMFRHVKTEVTGNFFFFFGLFQKRTMLVHIVDQ